MRTYRDAKAMAKSLRAEMRSRHGVDLSHAHCLEAVARQFGFDDWNVLAARLDDGPVRMEPPIPVVRIFSVDKAVEFYIDFLGFDLDWEHRFEPDLPLYAQVSRSQVKLHLSEHHDDGSGGGRVFIWMTGVREFHRELTERRYRYARPGIGEAPWAAYCMSVTDPFGNTLRFNEATQAS